MILHLEYKKVRRTGFIPAFLWGGIAAAAFPVLNTAVRRDIYAGIKGSPIRILLNANWSVMGMLNILLIVVSACILYHTEYADNGMRRMDTLPLTAGRVFFGKTVLMSAMYAITLAIEAAGIAFCSYHWFEFGKNAGWELLKNFGYTLLLVIPAVLTALLIASVCKNMWVSLGIGVVCVFMATMLPTDNFALSLFPFALPFQTLADSAENTVWNYIFAAAAESVVLAAAEHGIVKVRRVLE